MPGSSRCALHQSDLTRTDTRPSSSARGYDREWQRIRNTVMTEQPICQRCGVKPARDVHHLRPLRHGGTHDRANLVSLCRGCHLKVERQAVTR